MLLQRVFHPSQAQVTLPRHVSPLLLVSRSNPLIITPYSLFSELATTGLAARYLFTTRVLTYLILP